jgi:hypothetical protein
MNERLPPYLIAIKNRSLQVLMLILVFLSVGSCQRYSTLLRTAQESSEFNGIPLETKNLLYYRGFHESGVMPLEVAQEILAITDNTIRSIILYAPLRLIDENTFDVRKMDRCFRKRTNFIILNADVLHKMIPKEQRAEYEKRYSTRGSYETILITKVNKCRAVKSLDELKAILESGQLFE